MNIDNLIKSELGSNYHVVHNKDRFEGIDILNPDKTQGAKLILGKNWNTPENLATIKNWIQTIKEV